MRTRPQVLDYLGRPVRDERSSRTATTDVPLGEIASAGRDDLTAEWLGDLVAHKDEILKGLSGGIKEYKRLLDDWQVQSTVQQRFDAVLEKDVEVVPGGTKRADKKAAAFMEEALEHVKWNAVTEKALWGVFYGYTVAELLHARDGQLLFPDEIRVREAHKYKFARVRDEARKKSVFQVRRVTPGNPQGEPMPPRKFWWFGTGSQHDDDPYGLGLAHFLWWLCLFKRQTVGFNLSYLERWVQPVPVGKFRPGTLKDEQDRLLQALAALRTDGAIVIPDDMQVDSFEGSRSGSSSYGEFLEYLDKGISKVVLSQTMTTDDGSSHSQSETHGEVRDAVIRSDSRLVDESFSRHPARWYTEWNFPTAAPPIVRRKLKDDEDLNTVAERDVKLYQAGWVRTDKGMADAFGEGYERRDTGGPPPAAQADGDDASFAEGDAPLKAPDAFLPPVAQADAYVEAWLTEARALLDASGSLADFAERLLELYPDLDTAQIASVLGDGMTAAGLAGRYEVQEGA